MQKSSVFASHCSTINKILTPSLKDANMAKRIIKEFEKVLATENRQIIFQNRYLEMPAYNLALKNFKQIQ